MNDKLVEKLLANPRNLRMGNDKLAKRWRVSSEVIKEARRKARDILRQDRKAETANYISDLENELIHKVDVEKGTLESSIVVDYEPKDDVELARLHKVDLTKYKISSYWSKLKSSGKFTSSIFCTLRRIESDSSIQLDTLKSALYASFAPGPKVSHKSNGTLAGNGKALLIITADEHIAAANLPNDQYRIDFGRNEYLLRKLQIIEMVQKMKELHGSFDDIFDIKLGDSLDGWNGGTTRSGEPGHQHELPQNMNNAQAVESYLRVNNWYWDELIKADPGRVYHKYDITNSNHGGNGLDHIANLGVEVYLNAKYPGVKINYLPKFLNYIKYGPHNLILTHGKDEKYRKKPLPLNLNSDTEVLIKQFMDLNLLSCIEHNIVLKGDLHQWNWNQGKFFDYVNIPSLYGSSGWVMANFGLTLPSFAIGIMDRNSTYFNLSPVPLRVI